MTTNRDSFPSEEGLRRIRETIHHPPVAVSSRRETIVLCTVLAVFVGAIVAKVSTVPAGLGVGMVLLFGGLLFAAAMQVGRDLEDAGPASRRRR